MELATDIMAIFGWACLGLLVHGLAVTFRRHEDDKIVYESAITFAISFGLIAASIVLG